MARRRKKGRPIDGLLLLNKDAGETSNASLQKVRRLYHAQKAGHTGSLDPLATGMLPICFGEATKFSQFLLDADKSYRVTAKLGEKTETADADGEIIETCPVNISEKQLRDAIDLFRGEIEQIPSMYSALKFQGKPLYKYAREGIEIEREPRKVNIFEMELVNFETPFFTLEVECSKGTYIRNLVEDIGEELACGAHVTALHRNWAGCFEAEEMISLANLEEIYSDKGFTAIDELLMATDQLTMDYPAVELTDDMMHYILHGQALQVSDSPAAGLVRIYGPDYFFLGIGEIDNDGKVAPKRLISTQ